MNWIEQRDRTKRKHWLTVVDMHNFKCIGKIKAISIYLEKKSYKGVMELYSPIVDQV